MDGVLAQLVERLNGIQKVRSSSLLGSTILNVEKPFVFKSEGLSVFKTGSRPGEIGASGKLVGIKEKFVNQKFASADFV